MALPLASARGVHRDCGGRALVSGSSDRGGATDLSRSVIVRQRTTDRTSGQRQHNDGSKRQCGQHQEEHRVRPHRPMRGDFSCQPLTAGESCEPKAHRGGARCRWGQARHQCHAQRIDQQLAHGQRNDCLLYTSEVAREVAREVRGPPTHRGRGKPLQITVFARQSLAAAPDPRRTWAVTLQVTFQVTSQVTLQATFQVTLQVTLQSTLRCV